MATVPSLTRYEIPAELGNLIIAAAVEMAKQTNKAFRVEPRRRSQRTGRTLRPGKDTPLWNELRAQLQPYLTQYGQQVNLGRVLGLPRQRINSFVTGGGQMPDAERTLQLLAWLMAVRQGKRPS
ncbi:MAG: hypothetical protein HY302_10865 [Opitutae bacterium]|nr:hypothetical protein [Opitutae bacterium]